MILSVSGVLLLGVIVFILFRKDGLKVSHLIVCMMFGFYLASTSLASWSTPTRSHTSSRMRSSERV